MRIEGRIEHHTEDAIEWIEDRVALSFEPPHTFCFETVIIMKKVTATLLCLSLLLLSGTFGASEKPNILIILGDDCTHTDLPLYGGTNAKTPNIDRLATEGLTFNRAAITMAMCQPARSELYSGQYPMRNGAAWNHCKSYVETKSMPHYLGAQGYRVGISGKRHVLPEDSFPFEIIEGFDSICVHNPTLPHHLEDVKAFMEDDGQPFALVVGLVEPHKPWVMGDPSAYPPESIDLPEYLVDNDATRESFSRYLAEITYMDNQVGEILEVLKATGKANDTIVIYSSEQGAQWPGCKWTNWNLGVRTALVVKWPSHVPEGKRTDALVQWVDVVPTLLDIVGADLSDYPFDGFSFKSVLLEGGEGQREFLYSMHNNTPEGPSYPIRAISDGRYKYIHNLDSDAIYINKWIMGRVQKSITTNQYWQSWLWESTTNEDAKRIVFRYMTRPEEELYDLENDPLEMHNLVSDEGLSEIKARLAQELTDWMVSQRDPGVQLDTRRAFEAARNLEHVYRYSSIDQEK